MSFDEVVQVLHVLGAWIAGAGSLTAAIIALWLARRSEKVKLNSFVGVRVMMGGDSPTEKLLEIRTTNTGDRPVIIESVGWRIGSGKSMKVAVQTFSNRLSDQCPKKIDHGETASFRIFFSESDWLKDFADNFVEDVSEKRLKTLRVQIYTSVGQATYVIPEKSFLARIKEVRAEPSPSGTTSGS